MDKLQHHGIKGMKWGVRRTEAQLARVRGKLSTDSDALGKTAKRYDEKAKRGSLHSIRGLALQDMGFSKASKKAYAKADYKEAKWTAKAERARKIKKAYDSYLIDLSKYDKNDVEAIIRRSELYDAQVKDIKESYKDQIKTARQSILT